MAHHDKTRGGSEKGQRQHAGKTSEYSDAGMQRKSQGIAGGADSPPDAGASASDAQREEIFPEAHREEGGDASRQGLDRDAGDGQAAPSAKTSRGGQKSNVGKR
jgi:hypothetical protein